MSGWEGRNNKEKGREKLKITYRAPVSLVKFLEEELTDSHMSEERGKNEVLFTCRVSQSICTALQFPEKSA